MTSAAPMFSENIVISDIVAGGFSVVITVSLLKLLEQTAARGVFEQVYNASFSTGLGKCTQVANDSTNTLAHYTNLRFQFFVNSKSLSHSELITQALRFCISYNIYLNEKLNRKLVHISFGLVFMLCWPMFSSGRLGAAVASLIPGVNIVNMLLLGSGIWKDDATVKSMTRHGDHRELLRGPLCYASALTFFTAIYWRTSPIAIAAFCNVCAGDGVADIFGRRFGSQKLPYNRNKSFAGSIAMVSAGFLASIGYMFYFSWFGYIEESSKLVVGFLAVSVVAALVESLPISTELDDNFTVPLAVVLVATLVF